MNSFLLYNQLQNKNKNNENDSERSSNEEIIF